MGHTILTGATGLLGRAFMRSDYETALQTRVVGTTRKQVPDSGYVRIDYSPASVTKLLKQVSSIERVIHCAGAPGVYASLRDPIRDHVNNFDPVLFTLELARNAGAELVLISSMEVYGSEDPAHRVETSPAGPKNFYGLDKLFCERFVSLYHEHYGVPYIILRPSIFFDREITRGLLYDLVSAFARKQPVVEIFCTADSLLNLVHVDEVVAALVHLETKGLSDDVWNVGSLESFRVDELIEWFSREFAHRADVEIREANHQTKTAPVEKLLKTGWKPRRTVRWYLEELMRSAKERAT